MMGCMFDADDLSIDCNTCVAAGTTACGDCLVNHLLANDDGPIDYVVAPVVDIIGPVDRVVGLFAAAGLVDDPPCFVPYDDFERGHVPAPAHPSTGRV